MGNKIKLTKIAVVITPFLMLVIIPSVFAQERMAFDLNKAISMVLEKNETYQIAEKEVDRANARIVEALTTSLPQFTANIQYLRNWEIP